MLPRKPLASAVLAISFVTLLYLVELIDVLLPVNLDGYGIVARSFDGLDGIVWAPLLHADWQHLFANTGPVVVFAFLAMAGGIGQWLMVTRVLAKYRPARGGFLAPGVVGRHVVGGVPRHARCLLARSPVRRAGRGPRGLARGEGGQVEVGGLIMTAG